MILIDYNGIAVGNIITQKLDIQEDLLRHMILNSIRMYRKKFNKTHGEVVICCDHGGNWRREVYPEYKASRRTDREASTMNWEEIFRILNLVRDELREHFPYKVMHVWGCEADDIIATLCEHTQEFGNYESVMIVSADKDFAQLQKWKNIHQFSPMTKKFIVEPNPRKFLFEHICRGDGTDGVPNILCDDKTFVEKRRQTQLRQTKVDAWADSTEEKMGMSEEIYRNFLRNKKMIDLTECPDRLKEEIINTFDGYAVPPKSGVMSYMIKKRCNMLLGSLGDFL